MRSQELIDLAKAKHKELEWLINKYNSTKYLDVQNYILTCIIKEEREIAVIERKLYERGYIINI